MDTTIIVAVIGAVATLAAAIISAVVSHCKRDAENASKDISKPIVEALSTPIRILGDAYRVTDDPANLVIDTLEFGVKHQGVCVNESDSSWWESGEDNFAPTLSIGLSNPGNKDILLKFESFGNCWSRAGAICQSTKMDKVPGVIRLLDRLNYIRVAAWYVQCHLLKL